MATNVSTVHFKAGKLVLIDSTGAAIPVAELTDIAVNHEAEDKHLPNDDQVARFSVRTGQKLSVKAKIQRALSSRLDAAMFGGTVTAGAAKVVVDRESHAAAGTVVAAGGAAFLADLGVYDSSGAPMEPVTATPAVGQYIAGVAGTGSYTFNIAQTGNLYLCYVKSSTTGEVVTVDNQPQAESPSLAGWFWVTTKQPDGTTKQRARFFYKLVPSKLSEAQKRGDWADSDIELGALADANGKFYEVHSSPGV